MKNEVSLKEIMMLFLNLGFIGFVRPASHIAMIRDKIIVKRKWMSE